ncbi:MAG: hypothetical protein BWY89_01285 [Bacteroidetes bacterium ADurb.BinA012]|nr:MAG: hypothetical protein BWY89_01285 [Bacteroidetes bacterium ADurb.BinA012]
MTTVIMFNIYCLGAIQGHTGIAWSTGEKIGSGTYTHGTTTIGNKSTDALMILMAQVQVLTTAATAGNNNSIEGIETSTGYIRRCDKPDSHPLINFNGLNSLPDTCLSATMPIEYTNFNQAFI